MRNRSVAAGRAVRWMLNAPVAASVARRHLARGTDHAASVTRRFLGLRSSPGTATEDTGAYRAALAALRAGDLSDAEVIARAARGLPARILAAYVAGELRVLRPEAAAPTHGATRRLAGAPVGRVLHLTTNALPEVVAGYTVRTHGIALAQRDAGLDAHVATRLGFPVTQGHLFAPGYVEVEGVPYHRTLAPLPLRPDAGLARDVERTARLVERLRPDVLHAHSNHLNGQVALALRRRYGIPVVYEVRGFVEETRRSADVSRRRSQAWRLAREAETWCMRQADAVVTLSETMRADILARGVPSGKVTVSPNAVPARFLVDHEKASRLRLAPGTVAVGVIGTLNSYEGVDVLVAAVARLRGVHLIVVGDGPARPNLEAMARGLPVTFVGHVSVEEVQRWHATIDIYCLPRLDLPVTRLVPPLKPVEAMAAARPVVASDLPPLRELVQPGVSGLLVPPGDVDALATALARLAADPELRRRFGKAARTAVSATRTWAAVANRYADLYARLTAPWPTDLLPSDPVPFRQGASE